MVLDVALADPPHGVWELDWSLADAAKALWVVIKQVDEKLGHPMSSLLSACDGLRQEREVGYVKALPHWSVVVKNCLVG